MAWATGEEAKAGWAREGEGCRREEGGTETGEEEAGAEATEGRHRLQGSRRTRKGSEDKERARLMLLCA